MRRRRVVRQGHRVLHPVTGAGLVRVEQQRRLVVPDVLVVPNTCAESTDVRAQRAVFAVDAHVLRHSTGRLRVADAEPTAPAITTTTDGHDNESAAGHRSATEHDTTPLTGRPVSPVAQRGPRRPGRAHAYKRSALKRIYSHPGRQSGQGCRFAKNGRPEPLLSPTNDRLSAVLAATPDGCQLVAAPAHQTRRWAPPVTLAAIEARWFSRTSSAGRHRKAGRPTSSASSRSGATASSVPIRAQSGGAQCSSGSRERAGRGGHHGTNSSVISGAAALAARTGAFP